MKKVPVLKIPMLIVLMVLLFASSTFAQTATATTESNVGVVSNPSIQQNFQPVDPGQGRWFVPPVQPYQAPVLPYLGPWSSGSNIIEDLRTLPEMITMNQAKTMYDGGVSARINKMEDNSYQFETCRLMHSLPMMPLLATDGKPVLDKDGKQIMIPDETKFHRVAFIFLQGKKKANTVDVIAKACIEAMHLGANSIYLIKKVTATSTHSSGWGIGLGGVASQLSGQGLANSQTVSSGTGYNSAAAEPVYKEGMVVIAIQNEEGMATIKKVAASAR